MPDRPDEAEEELGPDGKPKRDLRYSGVQDRSVQINRQLDGSGHLARGDRTNMSILNFSSRHPARTERDPEFAFRPPPEPTRPADPPAEPAAEPPAAAAGTGEGAEAPNVAMDDKNGTSVMDKLRNFFGV
ncbi:MAG: hypothetical protein AB7L66_17625 [Gemmatimonadales bacterium]